MGDGYLYLDEKGVLRSQSAVQYDELPDGWTRLDVPEVDYEALVSGSKVWDGTTLVDVPPPEPDPLDVLAARVEKLAAALVDKSIVTAEEASKIEP